MYVYMYVYMYMHMFLLEGEGTFLHVGGCEEERGFCTVLPHTLTPSAVNSFTDQCYNHSFLSVF